MAEFSPVARATRLATLGRTTEPVWLCPLPRTFKLSSPVNPLSSFLHTLERVVDEDGGVVVQVQQRAVVRLQNEGVVVRGGGQEEPAEAFGPILVDCITFARRLAMGDSC